MAEFHIPENDQEGYDLIHVQMRPMLTTEMNLQGVSQEEQYDVLMEFYLYLRDGAHPEEPHRPYEMLLLVRDRASLIPWIRTVFRRWFQRNGGKYVGQGCGREAEENDLGESGDSELFQTGDLMKVILLLEYVNEHFSAPERYVFFSDLDALRYGRKATSEIAEMLMCTDNNVRVMRTRVKAKIRKTLKTLTDGTASK